MPPLHQQWVKKLRPSWKLQPPPPSSPLTLPIQDYLTFPHFASLSLFCLSPFSPSFVTLSLLGSPPPPYRHSASNCCSYLKLKRFPPSARGLSVFCNGVVVVVVYYHVCKLSIASHRAKGGRGGGNKTNKQEKGVAVAEAQT